jgi:hypothetical protein
MTLHALPVFCFIAAAIFVALRMADVFERNGYQPAPQRPRKIGEGHAAAMGRLGLKELRNAVNPSRDSVADTEIGLYGTATQGEIAEARGNDRGGQGLDAHQEKPKQQTQQPQEPKQDRHR